MTLSVTDYKDGFTFTGATADQGPFSILGGNYVFSAIDTGSIDASLEILMPNGSYVAISAAATSTVVASQLWLPPAQVKVTIGTGTSLSASLIRVPTRGA